MYSAPRSRPGAAEEGAGLGGAASRGRGRAWRDGGRARKISFPNLLPSLLHTPLRSLLSHSLPRKLLDVNRLFLLLSKMGPASAEERGGRPGAGYIFSRAAPSLPRHQRAGEAGVEAGPGTARSARPPGPHPRPGPRRQPVLGRRRPARHCRGPAAPSRDEPPLLFRSAVRGRLRPVLAGGPGDEGPRRTVAFESGFLLNFFVLVFGLIFNFFSREGFAPPPLPESPRQRLLRVGAAGRRALRWRWAWPAARAGGAVARRPPSSLAAGGALCAGRQAGPGAAEPEPRSHARAAGSCGWSPRGHRDPRPKGWLAGLGAKGRRRLAFHLLSQAENSGMRSASGVHGLRPRRPAACWVFLL